jgi:Fe-S cluster assembly protein SufD
MSAVDSVRNHYLSRFEAFASGVGSDPDWLARLRREAIGSFADLGFPDTRLEEWRYTDTAPIAEVPFELPGAAPDGLSRDEVEPLSAPAFACSLFVFVDGRYDPRLSAPRVLAGGVAVESLARLRSEDPRRLASYLGKLVDHKRHPFAALNTAFLDDGAVLVVPPGTELERPMHLVFLDTGREPATVFHPRVLLVAGANSRATVIQDHVSLGGAPGFTNAVTEVFVERGGGLGLVLLQREKQARLHTSHLSVRLERDARFAGHTISLGGGLVRNDLVAVLGDQGADCILGGLFVADGSQLIDNHTTVDHAMPHGSSRQLYKGILGGKAKGVFRGRVIVRPDAQHTDAKQSNPNLLLSDQAEVDSKPQLEIYADDVKCSHGSAIGQLQKEALFYLMTRGIAEAAARELLARGFASEVTRALSIEPLREQIDLLVSEKLDRSSRTKEAA